MGSLVSIASAMGELMVPTQYLSRIADLKNASGVREKRAILRELRQLERLLDHMPHEVPEKVAELGIVYRHERIALSVLHKTTPAIVDLILLRADAIRDARSVMALAAVPCTPEEQARLRNFVNQVSQCIYASPSHSHASSLAIVAPPKARHTRRLLDGADALVTPTLKL